jgi:hypothetical protein
VRHRERPAAAARGRAWLFVPLALAGLGGATAIASCNWLTGISQLGEVDSAAPCGAHCIAEAGDAGGRVIDAHLEDSESDAHEKDVNVVCSACGGPSSASCCAGDCVDLSSDPSHCGSCDQTCSSGVCGTAISGWPTSPWRVNGTATFGMGDFGTMTGILTNGGTNGAGTIVYTRPVVVDSFTATFLFYIGGGTTDPDADIVLGGDGLAFVFESTGPDAVTTLGSCFGVCGLTGFGVELDTYDNEGCGDTSANHVAVDDLTKCTAPGGSLLPTTLFANNSLPFTLSDGKTHMAVVQLDKGAVTVTLDGTAVVTSFLIPKFVEGSPYYFGFGGGSGGAVNFHEVSPDLTITFPTPRCL